MVVHRLLSCSMQAEWLCGRWDLSSPTRDQTRVLCSARGILNRWTTREVPVWTFEDAYSTWLFGKHSLVSVVLPLLDISIPNLPSLEAPSKIFLVHLLCARDSQACGVGMKVKLLGHVQLFATPGTVAYQAPPSTGFSRQEYWSGLPFPSPGDLPSPGIEPGSSALQTDTFPFEPSGVA